MTVSGIDVASYQSDTYSTASLSFVFVKATESTNYVNPRYAAQVAHGRSAGLVVGHYHFQRPGDGAAQADYFLAHARLAPGDLIACDWEDSGVSQAQRDAFVSRVKAKAPGHKVVLYCNRSFWADRDSNSGGPADGLWIADPGASAGHPRVNHAWTFHQYSEAGGLDHDVANFASAAALRAWAQPTAAKPKPPVTPSKPKPPALVAAKHVSLRVVAWAATHSEADERKYPQNFPQTYAVQLALVANGRLRSGDFVPGIFDVATARGYEAEQRAQGYKGTAADGVPGPRSLAHLAKQRGFTAGA
jgi:Lyzozyme M1 (1,4-beta-N-acetylmuramidase)